MRDTTRQCIFQGKRCRHVPTFSGSSVPDLSYWPFATNGKYGKPGTEDPVPSDPKRRAEGTSA